MSLDRLVEEIAARGAAQVRAIEETTAREAAKITAERDRRVLAIQQGMERAAAIEASRERAQRVAAAKLRSRQRLYEAREARLKSSLAATQQLLADFTNRPEYPKVLERMYRYATETLGDGVRLKGRAEDAAALKKIAPGRLDPNPAPIVGGLIAETADGSRSLDLSFNELLRLREDRVRELLAS